MSDTKKQKTTSTDLSEIRREEILLYKKYKTYFDKISKLHEKISKEIKKDRLFGYPYDSYDFGEKHDSLESSLQDMDNAMYCALVGWGTPPSELEKYQL